MLRRVSRSFHLSENLSSSLGIGVLPRKPLSCSTYVSSHSLFMLEVLSILHPYPGSYRIFACLTWWRPLACRYTSCPTDSDLWYARSHSQIFQSVCLHFVCPRTDPLASPRSPTVRAESCLYDHSCHFRCFTGAPRTCKQHRNHSCSPCYHWILRKSRPRYRRRIHRRRVSYRPYIILVPSSSNPNPQL